MSRPMRCRVGFHTTSPPRRDQGWFATWLCARCGKDLRNKPPAESNPTCPCEPENSGGCEARRGNTPELCAAHYTPASTADQTETDRG